MSLVLRRGVVGVNEVSFNLLVIGLVQTLKGYGGVTQVGRAVVETVMRFRPTLSGIQSSIFLNPKNDR